MKQVLLIDFARDGVLEAFAGLSLDQDRYETWVVQSADQAEALLSDGYFDLIVVGPWQQCTGTVWPVVELAREMSLGRSTVIVSSNDADAVFHDRARQAGAAVLSAPAAVGAKARVQGASSLGPQPVTYAG